MKCRRAALAFPGFVCSLLAALALSACGGSSSSSKNVYFAELNDYTGAGSGLAGYGDASQLSAIYEINAAGGILGKKVVNVPIDTRSDPADGLVSVVRAMATTNFATASGPGTSEAPAIVPVLSRKHIMIDCVCGNPLYDHTTDPYFWRLYPPDPVGGETLALFAKQLGYQRVAAVFATDPSSQGDLPGVLTGVKATGLNLVANIGLTPDQTSYRTQVEQVIAAHPQLILTESDPPTAATFFGELKQLGKLVPIWGTTATAITAYLKPLSSAIGDANLRAYFRAQVPLSPPMTPAVDAYNTGIRHVANKLPHPVSQWYSSPGTEPLYDGLIAFALAMTASKSTDPTVANQWVYKVTAPGPGKTPVYSYAQGVADLKAGKQIQYIGASGPVRFDQWHNSFGDQAVARMTPNGAVVSQAVITAARIQALGP